MMEIYRTNLSDKLKEIFYSSLNKPKQVTPSVERRPPYQPKLFNNEFSGVIYFYEWSDITRTPKTFYSLEKFEEFINRCYIYMHGYQREILRNMHNPYITCKKGEKELLIKSNYTALKNALESPPLINFGSEEKEPYDVSITRPPIQKPKMVFEPESRYPESMPMCGRNEEYWDWG